MTKRMVDIWQEGHWVRVGFERLDADSLFRVVEPDGSLMVSGRVYIAGGRSFRDSRGGKAVVCKPDGFVVREEQTQPLSR